MASAWAPETKGDAIETIGRSPGTEHGSSAFFTQDIDLRSGGRRSHLDALRRFCRLLAQECSDFAMGTKLALRSALRPGGVKQQRILGCRIRTLVDIWKPSLVVVITLLIVTAALGAHIDNLFFDQPGLFYGWALPAWSVLSMVVLVCRFALTVVFHDPETHGGRAREVFDTFIFFFFFALVHAATRDLLQGSLSLLESSNTHEMTQALTSMVADEEFLPADSPHGFKNVFDVATKGEFW